MKITAYNKNSGVVINVVDVTPAFEFPNSTDAEVSGVKYVDGEWSPDEYYINNGAPVQRLDNPTSITGTTLSNVPENSTLTVDGQQYSVSGTVELDFTPGVYHITVESPVQYKPKEFTVEINS
jgi:hypothetical protein